MAEAHVAALRSSVVRLRDLASPLSGPALTRRAYPDLWSVADVLSHLGSGAVITQRRLEDALVERATPDDFAPAVWDAWNAKSPSAQRDDALVADAQLLARIEAVTAQQRSRFTSAMGPMTLGFAQFVAMRLNEHAFHTWDIQVVDDPTATLPQQVAAVVVDNLELVARFTAKPTGETRSIAVAITDGATVATTDTTNATAGSDRAFRIELTPESVTFGPSPVAEVPDLTLPAEAFARLIYGRLDVWHAPPGEHGPALHVLRKVFPGP